MKEDVKGIIAKLIELYEDGKIKVVEFQDVYGRIVPTRINIPIQDVEFDGNGMPHFVDRNSKFIPEGYKLKEVTENIENYVTKWVKSVNDLLARLEQSRFRLQFNDPNQRGFFTSSLGETTSNEDRLYTIIDNLTMRHDKLRQIILELERSNEMVKNDDKHIEPATYSKKTRTLSFAGKDIRFKENAPFTPALCDVIFSSPNKLWLLESLQKVWDDQYDYLPERPTDWHRVYEAVNRINLRVYKRTDIDDLFILSTTSVRLNPAYLNHAK